MNRCEAVKSGADYDIVLCTAFWPLNVTPKAGGIFDLGEGAAPNANTAMIKAKAKLRTTRKLCLEVKNQNARRVRRGLVSRSHRRSVEMMFRELRTHKYWARQSLVRTHVMSRLCQRLFLQVTALAPCRESFSRCSPSLGCATRSFCGCRYILTRHSSGLRPLD